MMYRDIFVQFSWSQFKEIDARVVLVLVTNLSASHDAEAQIESALELICTSVLWSCNRSYTFHLTYASSELLVPLSIGSLLAFRQSST